MKTKSKCSICYRRDFLRMVTMGSAVFFTAPGAFAEVLERTPKMTEGPFYPDKLPLDTDNDLLLLNDGITPAVGEVTHLGGVVLDTNGQPARNTLVEIWQTDNKGTYLHSQSRSDRGVYDSNFQGYGRCLTDSKGRYYFRTIKPKPYAFRTAHIHVAVSQKDKRILTTQCFIEGHPDNKKDRLLGRIKKPSLLVVPFVPLEGSISGELTARFDMFIGHTPADSK